MYRGQFLLLAIFWIASSFSITSSLPADLEESDNRWTDWSSWTSCSRHCDGGVTYRTRKCMGSSELCPGKSVTYKICNIQACEVHEDFRSKQCSAFDSAPYRDRKYEWLPFHDPDDPCSLTCQAKGFNFVAKLDSKVHDGTRCRSGTLDMCVAGVCMTVGCDLELGSTKIVDECGVCGGDSSSCQSPDFIWKETPFSACSTTCGGGYQMSGAVCINRETAYQVDETFCNRTTRLRPQIKVCNSQKCSSTWTTETWGPCSSSCGGGKQTRPVYCVQANSRHRVDSSSCPKNKPSNQRVCNSQMCPIWLEGPWSGCSVTCGPGVQVRTVECVDSRGKHSSQCDPLTKPPTKYPCSTGIVCQPIKDPEEQDDAPHPFYSLPWAQKLISSSPVSSEPNFVAGEWEACSVTCGDGVRKRTVACKIFLEFSKTVANLPDTKCPGIKPHAIETCFLKPCALDQNKEEKDARVGIEVTYSWKESGFSPCSASCLGGIRESIVQCIRDHDQAVVSSSACDIKKKPDSVTQTCNDHPCPPRWNVSEFSSCSKTCGGGLQTRSVQCLHEVTRGTTNTLVVSNDLCPQPPPRAQQFCNVFDCPNKWHLESWSKCSKSCGGGIKTRKIKCQKDLAFGQILEQSPSSCPKKRPKTVKTCNSKPCVNMDSILNVTSTPKPEIFASKQMYIQQKPHEKVDIKIGGSAILFQGTNLKIRCPTRRVDKNTIIWYKDSKKLQPSKKFKISRKGALRIRKLTLLDRGTYTCAAGNEKADLKVSVKSLPPILHAVEDNEAETTSKPLYKSKFKEIKELAKIHPKSKEEQLISKNHLSKPPYLSKENAGSFEINSFSSEGKSSKPSLKEEKQVQENVQRYNINTSSKTKEEIITEKQMLNSGTSDVDKTDHVYAHYQTDTPSHRTESPIYHLRHFSEAPFHTSTIQRYPPPKDDHFLSADQQTSPTKFENWGVMNYGEDLISDQDSRKYHLGVQRHEPKEDEPAKSSASHPLPHIQQLLVNLHHTLGSAHPLIQPAPEEEEEEQEADVLNPSSFMTNSFVLGKGKAENLEFDWMITEWSECSEICGGNGFQVRATQCLVKLNNISKNVDANLCIDAGLSQPETIQKCGYDECPHWQTGTWSECTESSCFTWHTAFQKRSVECKLSNDSLVNASFCDEKTRPRKRRECYSEKCKGTWKVGEWSECTKTCGTQGFQSRILQCVWYGTRKPAGNACRDQPRPPVMRPCRGPPCEASKDCVDKSKYCSQAKHSQMCRLDYYHQKCCISCGQHS